MRDLHIGFNSIWPPTACGSTRYSNANSIFSAKRALHFVSNSDLVSLGEVVARFFSVYTQIYIYILDGNESNLIALGNSDTGMAQNAIINSLFTK